LERLVAAADGLMRRSAAAGEVRDDLSGDDLIRATFGTCYSREQPDWQAAVLRLIDKFVDRLQTRD
jgi:hypothetical protein